MGRLNVCLECGASMEGARRDADFCSSTCRAAFNNRRLQRGAEFYDVFMALRFDRTHATTLKAWRLICRMASEFRREDWRERGGRKSWRNPEEIAARRPYLLADVLLRGRAA